MSLEIGADGSIVDAPRKPRAFCSAAEDRQLILKAAFNEISEAQPRKLRQIIERATALKIQARLSRDPALEAGALEIETRATRRLAWFRRKADSPGE